MAGREQQAKPFMRLLPIAKRVCTTKDPLPRPAGKRILVPWALLAPVLRLCVLRGRGGRQALKVGFEAFITSGKSTS